MRSIYFKLCLSKSLLLPTGSLLPLGTCPSFFPFKWSRREESKQPNRDVPLAPLAQSRSARLGEQSPCAPWGHWEREAGHAFLSR